MEYIVINEIPYKKISYSKPMFNNDMEEFNNCNTCNNLPNKRGAVICILIILILIVIVIIGYLFYSTSGSTNQNNFKNGFQASPKAQKDYDTITNLLQKNPDISYSGVKNAINDMDIAKYNQIMKHKDTHKLRPELFDNI
jgi:flagellar basal body-associated protein FliL